MPDAILLFTLTRSKACHFIRTRHSWGNGHVLFQSGKCGVSFPVVMAEVRDSGGTVVEAAAESSGTREND